MLCFESHISILEQMFELISIPKIHNFNIIRSNIRFAKADVLV